ncbi:MAG: prolipoprotein diacylglyceryl transferase [Desulfobacteraceae bacterium]|nr:prolipoprotein diacylglyceryl transferase [Desulfobacteraceae bacterium]
MSALFISKKMRKGFKNNLTPHQRLQNLAGLITGAIIGSKIPVIISYGFHLPVIFTSKSIYGALIGAYIGINISKRVNGIKTNFGDMYILPLCMGVFWGKFGCYFNGCCASPDYPIQIWSAGFHLLLFFFFYYLHTKEHLTGGHFALYMILYSLFRFCSEFIRTEPQILFNFTIYQMMAMIITPYFIYVFSQRIFKKRERAYS